jgi:polyisoprenoid-binding protein YceI
MTNLRAATALTALLAVPAFALPAWAGEPEPYALDPVHTRVLFAVGHAGFSKALGTVSGSHGYLLFDPEDWTTARLDVRVPLDDIDLGDGKWNAAVRAGNLLDVGRHPEVRFVATDVEPIDADHASVCGELTLRGVTRPQCLDVALNALKRHPMPPFRQTVGFSATTTLSRAAYGIDAWKSVIDDEVELRIEAEAARDYSAMAKFAEPAAASPIEAQPESESESEPEPEPEPTP